MGLYTERDDEMEKMNFPFYGDSVEALAQDLNDDDGTTEWARKFIAEHEANAREAAEAPADSSPVRKARTFNQVRHGA